MANILDLSGDEEFQSTILMLKLMEMELLDRLQQHSADMHSRLDQIASDTQRRFDQIEPLLGARRDENHMPRSAHGGGGGRGGSYLHRLAVTPQKRGRGTTISVDDTKTASANRDTATLTFRHKSGSDVRRTRLSQARGASEAAEAPPHGEWWRERLLAESRQALDEIQKSLSMLASKRAGLLESSPSRDLTGHAMAAGPRPMMSSPERSRATSAVVLTNHHELGSAAPALPTLKSRSRSRRSI